MSDFIGHECGIALIRLRKELSYYIEKYGSAFYPIHKLYLLMEKQHNRGQDGAGVAVVKIDSPPGQKYMRRFRSVDTQALSHVFEKITKKITKKDTVDEQAIGEVWLGHLRYGTHGNNQLDYCHPMIRPNSWKSRSMLLAGNFNMTNVEELFSSVVKMGQHPQGTSDTITILERMAYFLDQENQRIYEIHKDRFSNEEISPILEEHIQIENILSNTCAELDGGYAIAGMLGYGLSFVVRDPAGIRPAYYYADDEVVVVASEKPAIKTAFNVQYSEIKEIEPGSALIITKKGDFYLSPVIPPIEKRSCSFERIYFSRGTDPDIYHERKLLGSLLCPQVLKAIRYDIENTVFSYIPNTAETAFLGMLQAVENYLVDIRRKVITEGKLEDEILRQVLSHRPRVEKLIHKDIKLRTFITQEQGRAELVAHVYDVAYEVVRKEKDTIVVVDDSIVRGTTLQKSILKMLDRLSPKEIVIVSSAPQIRYPDCYGIDMSKMNDFIAFQAVVALIRQTGQEHLLEDIYELCIKSKSIKGQVENHVKKIYEPFTTKEVSQKIAEIIRTPDIKAEVKVIYQKVKNLHKACPNHIGDWYFTGDYPTPGGNRVANQAFIYYIEGKNARPY